ncbi:TolC family protein [Undibacterium fentianense]|uniref:TolC family protein n=1 Tax=Undibacterium fentianense TaxID=2828728 RepID=A0A941E047_9BURK|nr:TolC family protein [Undibacterium fentianense]MBR7798552.1 TolC family protein [Undibacterium fentianense]
MSSIFVTLTAVRHNTFAIAQRISSSILIIGLVLASFNALAADGSLTLYEAQQLAVKRSRQVVAQDMTVKASRDMAIAAGQLPDPVLKVGIDNLPLSGQDQFSLTRDFMTMRRIGIMQEIPRADKRQLRAERYERNTEKTLAEKDNTIAAIYRDTALAWLERYYAEQMLAVVMEQVNQAKLEIKTAEAAYRAGRGSQADILAAHSALALVEDRFSEIGRRVLSAKAMLARWIGETAQATLIGQPAIDNIPLDMARLDTQLSHHPQITALTWQATIADTDVKLAQANKKADWTIEATFQQRGPAYSNMVSVGVSIPFQWDQKNRQDRELASKLAMAEQAKAERDEIWRARVAEIRSMIYDWQSGRERMTRFQNQLVPLAISRTEAVITAYRGGKSNLAEVLSTRRNEIDVRLQALQLQADTARLWAQLQFLFPVDTQDGHLSSILNKEFQ